MPHPTDCVEHISTPDIPWGWEHLWFTHLPSSWLVLITFKAQQPTCNMNHTPAFDCQ